MARIKGDASGVMRRSFNKSLFFSVRRGQTTMSAWPKKASGTPSRKLQLARDLMRGRSNAVKAMAPEIVFFSVHYAKGTALMPRDWLFMGMAGRYVAVYEPDAYVTGEFSQDGLPDYRGTYVPITPDGPFPVYDKLRQLFPMAALDDLSFLLDIFGQDVGTLFYRTEAGWRGLPPGPGGSVLTIAEDGTFSWQAGGSGGGGPSVGSIISDGEYNQSGAAKGNIVSSAADVLVSGFNVLANWQSGDTYVCFVGKNDGPTMTTILQVSDPFTATSSGKFERRVPLNDPMLFNAGEEYVLGFLLQGYSTITQNLIQYSNRPHINFPVSKPVQAWYANRNTLTVPFSITRPGTSGFNLGIMPIWQPV